MVLPNKFRVSFRVEGQPIPKQSFRIGRNGGRYQPKAVTDYQEDVGTIAKNAMKLAGGRDPMEGKVCASLVFKRKETGTQKTKVNLDNLAKNILDAMNEIVYRDDAQVHELHVYLERGVEFPEVLVSVEQM